MIRKSVLSRILTALTVLLVTACAQQVAPTGGERDVTPPEVLKVIPQQETTNFNSDKIIFTFDEYVKLNKLKDQLLISPPLKYDLSPVVKGKSLFVEIEDSLLPNTTYLFNFGNAIVDVRENNPIPDFQYVMSTGAEIDTNELEGIILDAFKHSPKDGMLVMLYDSDATDSIPYLERPTYVSRTDKSGKFIFRNIKAAKYKVFALEDENSNYLYDKADGAISFIDSTVSVPNSNDKLKLFAFEEFKEIQYLKEQNEKGPRTDLILNLPADSLNFEILSDSVDNPLMIKHKSPNNDSLTLWWREMDKQKVEAVIIADTLRDTLSIKVDSARANSVRMKTTTTVNYYSQPQLNFNFPIDSIRLDSVTLFDADSNAIPFQLSLSVPNLAGKVIAELKQGEKYRLLALPGAFENIYGHKNDTIERSFNVNREEEFGNLKIEIEDKIEGQKLLQLLNSGNKVLQEVVLNTDEHTFKYLKGGEYRLKLIYDANNNGIWDTGNYLQQLQAEKVVVFDEIINIRSNWDKEIEWLIK